MRATSSTRRAISPLARAAQLQPEAEVAAHGQVRVERVALEHHRDVALARVQPRDVAVADVDRARGDLDDPGEHLQQRRLAAARRADEHHELAVADLEVDVVDGARAVLVASSSGPGCGSVALVGPPQVVRVTF